MMQAERIHTISVMRVLAMIMIVSFHSLCFYTHRWWRLGGTYIPIWDKTATLLDTIDLPMFVFISGFLFGHLYIKGKYHERWAFIQGKARRLLVPYFFWGFFLIISMPSLHEWGNLLTGISHLWFLLMLFEIFTIVIPFAHFLCQKATEHQAIIAVLGAFLLYIAYHTLSNHHAFLCIHTTLFYLPTFLIGLFCARFKMHNYLTTSFSTILLLTSLTILTLYCYTMEPLSSYVNNIILWLLGHTIVFASFSLLCKIPFSGKLFEVIMHFDRLSMGIYIFNQICINALLLIPKSVAFFNQYNHIGPIVIFAVGFFIPWLLTCIFNCNKYTKLLIG